MTAFDFPNSPTNGQVFSPPGGPTYQWSSATGAWMVIGAAMSAFSGPVPPSNPMANQLWFETDTGNLFIWYDDGNSKQWVQVAGQQRTSPGLWPTADARNRIVNPAMQHSQENGKGTTFTASGTYVADQWVEIHSMATGAPAFACVAPAGGDFGYVRMNSTAANASPAAGDYYMLAQYLEGLRFDDFFWGYSWALPAVLRFSARSNFAGTFGVSVRNGTTNNRSFVKNVTVPGDSTWHTYTVAIPGDVTGTWNIDNSRGYAVYFALVSGSSFIGVEGWQANAMIASPGVSNWMATSGRFLDITNVGLHLDPQVTGLAPPWQEPDYASELTACQRYFRLFGSGENLVSGYGAAGGVVYGQLTVSPPMRTAPTHAFVGTATYSNASGIALNSVSASVVRQQCSVTAVGMGYAYSSYSLNARM